MFNYWNDTGASRPVRLKTSLERGNVGKPATRGRQRNCDTGPICSPGDTTRVRRKSSARLDRADPPKDPRLRTYYNSLIKRIRRPFFSCRNFSSGSTEYQFVQSPISSSPDRSGIAITTKSKTTWSESTGRHIVVCVLPTPSDGIWDRCARDVLFVLDRSVSSDAIMLQTQTGFGGSSIGGNLAYLEKPPVAYDELLPPPPYRKLYILGSFTSVASTLVV